MKRRTFIGQAGMGALGLGAGSGAAGVLLSACAGGVAESEPGSTHDFTAWAWVHGGDDRTPQEWRERFGRLAEAGFHAVLVGGGDTGMLAEAAHSQGLGFHRWMWMLNRNGDTWAMENHPEWFTVSREGRSTLETPPYVDYYRWVCPSRAPVREYLAGLVSEMAATEGVDGVHLDYIRHSDVILPRALWETYDLVQDREHPQFDYCYCEVCREQFEAQTGRDPMELEDAPSDSEWVKFRWDSVTRVVTELAAAVHAHDKPISAAVFPTPTIARQLVRQAWDEWPVDMLFPMLYHSFYEEAIPWIGEGVREGVRALAEGVEARSGSPTELRAGLYLPDLTPSDLVEAIRLSRAEGAAGFSVFEMNGLTDEHLAAVRGLLSPR